MLRVNGPAEAPREAWVPLLRGEVLVLPKEKMDNLLNSIQSTSLSTTRTITIDESQFIEVHLIFVCLSKRVACSLQKPAAAIHSPQAQANRRKHASVQYTGWRQRVLSDRTFCAEIY